VAVSLHRRPAIASLRTRFVRAGRWRKEGEAVDGRRLSRRGIACETGEEGGGRARAPTAGHRGARPARGSERRRLVPGGDGGQHGCLAPADGAAAEIDAHDDVGEPARREDAMVKGATSGTRSGRAPGADTSTEKVSLSASKPNEPTGEGEDGDGETAQRRVVAVAGCGRRRRRVGAGWLPKAGTREGRGRSTVGSRWMKRTVQIYRWQNKKRQATLRALISSIDSSFYLH
jgi:hypothetical protein